MNNYVVHTMIEIEAKDEAEAEELVLGLDVVDDAGNSLPAYVEIEKVVKVDG